MYHEIFKLLLFHWSINAGRNLIESEQHLFSFGMCVLCSRSKYSVKQNSKNIFLANQQKNERMEFLKEFLSYLFIYSAILILTAPITIIIFRSVSCLELYIQCDCILWRSSGYFELYIFLAVIPFIHASPVHTQKGTMSLQMFV